MYFAHCLIVLPNQNTRTRSRTKDDAIEPDRNDRYSLRSPSQVLSTVAPPYCMDVRNMGGIMPINGPQLIAVVYHRLWRRRRVANMSPSSETVTSDRNLTADSCCINASDGWSCIEAVTACMYAASASSGRPSVHGVMLSADRPYDASVVQCRTRRDRKRGKVRTNLKRFDQMAETPTST